ncbi:MAG: polyamine aminopropyltransferase [Chitinivibrionales bacterium]|nr:polyamine aminopropyltransferase [Chitinivibrionales bacterium]
MSKSNSPRIFSEALNPHFGYYYSVKESLYKGTTAFQKIELIDTDEFGRTLLLDDITQVVEKNDFQYHEPMVHPALCCHPAPRDVLVIGGGDGGILREVLKHESVRKIEFAELDSDVVAFSRKYLAAINEGAFDNPRVRINFTDGRKFVEKRPGEFDVVIMDMTDPFGPSKMLYTREFFKLVRQSFKDAHGIFVMHSESPIARPVAFGCIHKTLSSVFANVRCLYTYIQMYAVLWSISVCSDGIDIGGIAARRIDSRLKKNKIDGLKLYTGATHEAMQVAYPYIADILKQKAPIITDKHSAFPDHFAV